MKLLAGVLLSLASLNAFAEDAPNGIICGEYEHSTSQGNPGVGQIQPITNGFILSGTGVIHGGNSYTAINPDTSGSKGVVRAYYQAGRNRMLFISDDDKGMATITVGQSSDLEVKDIYTSCTYLFYPAKTHGIQPDAAKATQAVYRF